ncbi:hypothetical protein, partial [Streptomyces cinereoruber]|uniref:hypothetical protein n=1 Tax=Streptomyces cinereoruber TaxID=67260 RepID=UPI003657EB2C
MDENTLRRAVRQAAALYHLQAGGDEGLAGALWNSGIVSVEEFGPLLVNPFHSMAVNPRQGWDPALACLQAVGHGDWDNALHWAVWASNGSVTLEILTNALHQIALDLGIDATVYPDLTRLAADLAAHTAGDLQTLQRWKDILTHTTHHPTPDLGPGGWAEGALDLPVSTLDQDSHQAGGPDTPHHLILDGSDPASSWTTTGQDPAQAGWTDGWAGEWADGELDHLMTT